MMNLKFTTKKSGITLLEIIIAIIMICIIVSIALPRILNVHSNAEKVAVESFVRSLVSAKIAFVMKMAICDKSYAAVNNVSFDLFVKFSGDLTNQVECDSPWYTIAVEGAKNNIAADPNSNILVDPMHILIVTKTNHVVTITQDATTGDITWEVIPSY